MQRVRLAVRENALSDPSRITVADYIAALDDLGRSWVVEADGEIVAFATGYRAGSIWALFVHPDHEGRGYGKALTPLWSTGYGRWVIRAYGSPPAPARVPSVSTRPRAGSRVALFRAGNSGLSWVDPDGSQSEAASQHGVTQALAIKVVAPRTITKGYEMKHWLVALSLVAGASCAAVGNAPTVTVEQGQIQGLAGDGVTAYKGVPFAAPPVGDLRWKEPQPPTKWGGVLEANSFAPACIQSGVSMPGEPQPPTSEDCLYLNLWVPDHAPESSEAFPVMVWIYGGAFSSGATSFPLYSGERLARKGVIVVSVSYRVGPIGFLAHPELTAESPHATSGNYGLMDQIAALEWIQENIASFGGDPDRVTVFGQSAGAMSIAALMASPLTGGLFHGAIAQSGGLFVPFELAPDWILENAEKEGEAYAESLGADSIAELRGYAPERLLEGKAGTVSHPVVEPYLLPEPPYQRFVAGRQHDVPLLLGSNADEARSMLDPSTVRAETFEEDIARKWGGLPAALLEPYSVETDEEALRARLDFERDLRFGWDMWAWARLHARTAQSPVHYYRFAHEPPFPVGSPYEGWGSGHWTELWYVFDQLDREPWNSWDWEPEDRQLASAMSTYWTNFAKSGTPNGEGVPEWPAYSHDEGSTLYLQEPIAVGEVPDRKSLEVFDAVYSKIRGEPFGVGE